MKTLKRIGLFLVLKLKELGIFLVGFSLFLIVVGLIIGITILLYTYVPYILFGLIGTILGVMLVGMLWLIIEENWEEVKRRIP